MDEQIRLNNQKDFQNLKDELKSYYYDFDPHVAKFPCIFSYSKIESNGYPDIDQGDGRRDQSPNSPPTSSPFHPPSC